jgi:aryl-alcohol dehydrogenase-like predicted oxidoreductase
MVRHFSFDDFSGTSEYWGLDYTQEMVTAHVKLAVANGMTFFDTAEAYGNGVSETKLGIALKALEPE